MDNSLTPLRAPRSLPQLMQEIRAWERSVPRPPEPAEAADVADDAALPGVPAAPAQLIPKGRTTRLPAWASYARGVRAFSSVFGPSFSICFSPVGFPVQEGATRGEATLFECRTPWAKFYARDRAWERSVPRPPEPAEPADVADSAALAELPAAPPPRLIPTGRWTSRPTWAAAPAEVSHA